MMHRRLCRTQALLLGSLLALASAACGDKKRSPSPAAESESPAARDRSAWRIDKAKAPTANPPVVRADAGARAPHGVAEGGRSAPPPDRRLEPIPGWNPTHATLRLLRKVGEGDWDLSDLISDSRGLIFVDNTDAPMKAERYCGKRLSKASQRAMVSFQALLDRLQHEGPASASCTNKPRPPSCRTTELGHEGALFFQFADGERGIELVAIYTLALSALSDLEGRAQEEQEQAIIAAADKELLRLSAKPCSE